MRRYLFLIAVAVFLCLIAFFVALNLHEVPAAELARRCAAATPGWAGYAEDIKAQVGARPVALWQGRPIRAEMVPEGLSVAFALSPPWSGYSCALPVLVRLPSGRTCRDHEAVVDPPGCSYRFDLLPGDMASPPPWIEIRYPHGEMRLPLNAEGRWRE